MLAPAGLFRQRLRLGAFAGLLGNEFVEERGHPHAFDDETGPRPLDGGEKIASGIIDPGQLPQIHFDPSVCAMRGTPGVFCFSDPRALEPACEFQLACLVVFVNRDA